MKKQLQRILFVVILLGALGGIAYYVRYEKPPAQYQQGLYPVSADLAGKTMVLSDYIRYPGQEGRNALELLKKATGSDSLPPTKDDEHVWNLYVNAKRQSDAPDKVITHKADIVEWVLEKK